MSRLQSDFTLQNEGSILLLQPNTPAAESWVEEHVVKEMARERIGAPRPKEIIGDVRDAKHKPTLARLMEES